MSPLRRLWVRFTESEDLIALFGRFVGMGSNFILFWLLVRVLPPAQYAQLGLITGLQTFAHIILLGPVLIQIGREAWTWHEEKKQMERLSGLLVGLMLIYLVGNAMLVMLAVPLGWIRPTDILGVLIGTIAYALWLAVSSLLNTVGMLRERLPFATYIALDGLSRASAVGVLWLTHVNAPAWFYYLTVNCAGLAGTLVAYFVFHGAMAKYDVLLSGLWNTPNKFSRETLRFLIGSRSLRVASLFQWLSSTGNRYVLEPLISRTMLGTFLAAWGLGAMLLQAAEGLYSTVMLPVLYNRTSGERDTAPTRRAEKSNYLALWLAFLMPLLVVFIIFADRLALMLLGEQMGTPTTLVRAGLVFMAFGLWVNTFQSFSLVERQLRPNAFATAAALGIGLPALGLLTARYGIAIGAWGLVLGAAIGALVMSALFYTHIGWTAVVRIVPLTIAGTVSLVLAAWLVFTLAAGVIPGLGRWALFPAWGVVGALWTGYLWWGVRPQVTRTIAGMRQIMKIDGTVA